VARNRTRWALFNQTANRAVQGLLRSPLHPLASGRLALITVTGRRSGRKFTFPVSYVQEDGLVRITVGWPDQKLWWRNLRGEGGPVRLRIRGADETGHAVARGDEHSGVTVEVQLDGQPHERRA
jgi:F420H(2)-dependent quinone reductase